MGGFAALIRFARLRAGSNLKGVSKQREWPTMSFFSSLFGRLTPAPAEKVVEPVEYKGFIIRPAPLSGKSGHRFSDKDMCKIKESGAQSGSL
jgi:hypothetical protein